MSDVLNFADFFRKESEDAPHPVFQKWAQSIVGLFESSRVIYRFKNSLNSQDSPTREKIVKSEEEAKECAKIALNELHKTFYAAVKYCNTEDQLDHLLPLCEQFLEHVGHMSDLIGPDKTNLDSEADFPEALKTQFDLACEKCEADQAEVSRDLDVGRIGAEDLDATLDRIFPAMYERAGAFIRCVFEAEKYRLPSQLEYFCRRYVEVENAEDALIGRLAPD